MSTVITIRSIHHHSTQTAEKPRRDYGRQLDMGIRIIIMAYAIRLPMLSGGQRSPAPRPEERRTHGRRTMTLREPHAARRDLMQAAVYHGPRDIRVEDVPMPEIGEGE